MRGVVRGVRCAGSCAFPACSRRVPAYELSVRWFSQSVSTCEGEEGQV